MDSGHLRKPPSTPRRQHIIAGYIADFYCRAVVVAVEVDGPHHQHEHQQDEFRTQVLAQCGVRVVRVCAGDTLPATEPAPILHEAALREARTGRISMAASNDRVVQRESLLRRHAWLRGYVGTTKHLRELQQSLFDRMRNDLDRVVSREERARRPTIPCPGSRE